RPAALLYARGPEVAEARRRRGYVLGGPDRDDPRHGARHRAVDRANPGMRQAGTAKRDMHLAFRMDVRGVPAPARDQPPVFDPACSPAEVSGHRELEYLSTRCSPRAA